MSENVVLLQQLIDVLELITKFYAVHLIPNQQDNQLELSLEIDFLE